jgi:hypothetical protein
MPYDFMGEIKKSVFFQKAQIEKDEFENDLKVKLEQFKNPLIDFLF